MISQLQSDAIRAIIARDAETNPRLASILATRPALVAPGQTCERAEHQAAMAGLRPVYLPSPADEAAPPFGGDSSDLLVVAGCMPGCGREGER